MRPQIMDKSIFKQGKKYTFSDYFELNNPTEDIINALGYNFSVDILKFPLAENIQGHNIKQLTDRFYLILPKINLNSEIAKRDFMIAPLLSEVILYAEAKLNIEYSIEVNHLLSGSLDYLIRSRQNMIVIEAKRGDLDRGFNQLAAELIALDLYEKQPTLSTLYGAVSIGDIWRFGILKRKTKMIFKDIHSYRIPEDTEKIFMVLLGIIQSAST